MYNVIIIVECQNNTYSLPFGHAYNAVTKVCDREFGMNIASRQIKKVMLVVRTSINISAMSLPNKHNILNLQKYLSIILSLMKELQVSLEMKCLVGKSLVLKVFEVLSSKPISYERFLHILSILLKFLFLK